MADPRFYHRSGSMTLGKIAALTGAELADARHGEAIIADVAPLESAGPGDITFASGKHLRRLVQTAAGAAFVPKGTALPGGALVRLLHHGDPVGAFAQTAETFYPTPVAAGVWAPSADIHKDTRLGDGVEVGAGAVIGAGTEIGGGTIVGPLATIGPGVAIGRGCRIGAGAHIGYALIGDRVLIHAGVVIGSDGFGFVPGPKGLRKLPQLGRVIIQDDVEIGANTAIDRGAAGDTVIGEGTKIDNLVHIAHNCRIGRHCVIAGQVGLAGSVEIGDGSVLAGQVGVSDHVVLGTRVMAAAKAGISKSFPDGAVIAGYPARPVMQWRREVAFLSRLLKSRRGEAPGDGEKD